MDLHGGARQIARGGDALHVDRDRGSRHRGAGYRTRCYLRFFPRRCLRYLARYAQPPCNRLATSTSEQPPLVVARRCVAWQLHPHQASARRPIHALRDECTPQACGHVSAWYLRRHQAQTEAAVGQATPDVNIPGLARRARRRLRRWRRHAGPRRRRRSCRRRQGRMHRPSGTAAGAVQRGRRQAIGQLGNCTRYEAFLQAEQVLSLAAKGRQKVRNGGTAPPTVPELVCQGDHIARIEGRQGLLASIGLQGLNDVPCRDPAVGVGVQCLEALPDATVAAQQPPPQSQAITLPTSSK